MIYRKLTVLDFDLIMNMENDLKENFTKLEKAKHFLEDDMNWVFACILKEKIIGFAYGYELNRLDRNKNVLYIDEVSVLPEYQNRGIGTEIINGIKNKCKENGINRMFLFTKKTNERVCKLYEKTNGKISSEQNDDRIYLFEIN